MARVFGDHQRRSSDLEITNRESKGVRFSDINNIQVMEDDEGLDYEDVMEDVLEDLDRTSRRKQQIKGFWDTIKTRVRGTSMGSGGVSLGSFGSSSGSPRASSSGIVGRLSNSRRAAAKVDQSQLLEFQLSSTTSYIRLVGGDDEARVVGHINRMEPPFITTNPYESSADITWDKHKIMRLEAATKPSYEYDYLEVSEYSSNTPIFSLGSRKNSSLSSFATIREASRSIIGSSPLSASIPTRGEGGAGRSRSHAVESDASWMRIPAFQELHTTIGSNMPGPVRQMADSPIAATASSPKRPRSMSKRIGEFHARTTPM